MFNLKWNSNQLFKNPAAGHGSEQQQGYPELQKGYAHAMTRDFVTD
jgi:hypothetical protein